MMFFKESLHIENAEYNLPGVIYEVSDERMNIYAYIDKELKPETELSLLRSSMSRGQASVLDRQRLTNRQRLPTTNYLSTGRRSSGSRSSHTSEVTEPTKSNLVLVTKAAKDAPFNIEELKPLKNLKLKDILR